MYKIGYKPKFIRQYKKLPKDLQDEVKEKIELLGKDPKHSFLKTHKLNGELKNYWASSVNFAFRLVFKFKDKKEIVLYGVGDHDVYK